MPKEITFKGVVRRREVQTLEYKGERIIADLFEAFRERPLALVGEATLDPFGSGAAAILADAEKLGKHWTHLNAEKQRTVARAICDIMPE
jgi:dGTP triphosphohydrolase